jgi:hypothetical protein
MGDPDSHSRMLEPKGLGERRDRTGLRIASALLYTVSFAAMAVGIVYCLSPGLMPYHERFLGRGLDKLDPKTAELLMLMMKGAGAFFIALGAGTAILVRGAFRRGDPSAWWAILVMTLGAMIPLLIITLRIGLYTPWWAVVVMIGLVVAALVLARPAES